MIKIGVNRRRKNLFIADEVVVIILYKAEVVSYRDIVFVERAEDGILWVFFNIYVYYIAYMFFIYLLMFPFSDHGYHWGFKFKDIHW